MTASEVIRENQSLSDVSEKQEETFFQRSSGNSETSVNMFPWVSNTERSEKEKEKRREKEREKKKTEWKIPGLVGLLYAVPHMRCNSIIQQLFWSATPLAPWPCSAQFGPLK